VKKPGILGLLTVGLLVTAPMQSASAISVSHGESVVINFVLPRAGGPPGVPAPSRDAVELWTHFCDMHGPTGPTMYGVCFEGLDVTAHQHSVIEESTTGCLGPALRTESFPGA
jgi:hypothetical protein